MIRYAHNSEKKIKIEKEKSHLRIVAKGLQIFKKRRYIPLAFFSLNDY